jgi:hypothetical protein
VGALSMRRTMVAIVATQILRLQIRCPLDWAQRGVALHGGGMASASDRALQSVGDDEDRSERISPADAHEVSESRLLPSIRFPLARLSRPVQVSRLSPSAGRGRLLERSPRGRPQRYRGHRPRVWRGTF